MFLVLFMIAFTIFHPPFTGAQNQGPDTGKNIKSQSIQAAEELLAAIDKEQVVKVAKDGDKNTAAEWFKKTCASTKLLGEILEYAEEVDEGLAIFQQVIPTQIPEKVWIRYFDGRRITFGKIKEVVLTHVNRKSQFVYYFEEIAEKTGYALAAFSIAQDIYNALGSNDDRRLTAIYSTAKNVIFNVIFKKLGISVNPFISIGIDVLEWGLNTFIKQSFSRHKGDWERAYGRYMDKHYPSEYWDKLIKTTFNQDGGVSKTKIREALYKFWENPDANFYDIMNKSSTFSSTRGGALAEKYKKNIIADYYLWYIKPKITVLLRTEMMYARNEARYATINQLKKLLSRLGKDELENLKIAIRMAKDFKKATLAVTPANVRMKPGQSKTFAVSLETGGYSLELPNQDVTWNHAGGVFTAEQSMMGKTFEISAEYSGKKGSAKIEVGEQTSDALQKALDKAKKTLAQMTKTVTGSQKTISEIDGLCTAIKEQLALAEKALPDKEAKEKSPLLQYDGLKTRLEKNIQTFESLRKETNDDYTSAGLYKRNCEKQTLEACEKAQLLKRIRDAKTSTWETGTIDPALTRSPGGLMSAVSAAAAEAVNHGNSSLLDIKNIEANGKAAKELYDSTKDLVDSYASDIREAKKEENGKYAKSRKYLEKARTMLARLNRKISAVEKTGNTLKASASKTKQLLSPYKKNEKARAILEDMDKLYKEFTAAIKPAGQCGGHLKKQVSQFSQNHYKDKTQYDSRENRENLEKLKRLVTRAWGLLTGINQDLRHAGGLKNDVKNAIANAKKCTERAKEFLEKIREIQKERGESDSGFGDEDGGRDNRRCNFLARGFYSRLHSDREGALKEAEDLLKKAKDCLFYERGLRELNRFKKCGKLWDKYYAALDADNKELAKSIAKQKPECFRTQYPEDEAEQDGFSTSGGETTSGDSGDFSTSGGETVTTDTSSDAEADTDRCQNMEDDFYAALDTGDLEWAQSILTNAQDCPFYAGGVDMLQSAVDAQEDEKKREEENRCRKLYRELLNASKSNNLPQVKSILAKSRNCSFYDQGVKWLENAERNKYCRNLLNNFYNAVKSGHPATAQRIMENGRKAGCDFPPEANQLLAQAYNQKKQNEILRTQKNTQRMNNLLNMFSQVIRNLNNNKKSPYRPPVYTPSTPNPGGGGASVEGTGSVSSRRVNICIIDHNSIIDDYYDLYVNGGYIGPIRHGTGKRTCFNTMLRGGDNLIELKFVKAMGKNTALTISINNGEFKSLFRGSKGHRWSIRAPAY